MGAKHTPGPWSIEVGGWFNGLASGGRIGSQVREGTFRLDDNGMPILSFHHRTIIQFYIAGNGIAEDENRANARLIAAAPDLLEACKAACSEFDPLLHDGRHSKAYTLARAAIAKAETEEAA